VAALHRRASRKQTNAQLADLDRTFRLSERRNAEVLFAWLRVAIRNHYTPAMPAHRFLTTQDAGSS
jgi:hypothetical protein